MNPTPPTIDAPERREAISLERALEIRDAMIQVARNRAGVDGATQSQMREAQGEWLHGVLNELPAARPSETYAEWQQKRGMLADTIDWAVNEYDEFMKDDAYNAQAVLDRIIAKLRDRNALLAASSGEREKALKEAETWLRACSTWLLENDLDMKMPSGVLDTDPLDIADRLAALATVEEPKA